MSIRNFDVIATKLGIRVAEKSLERCEFGWFSADRAEIVSLSTYLNCEQILILGRRNIGTLSGRSKIGRDEIKWQELLSHFRSVQARHEKARRQAMGHEHSPIVGLPEDRINETDKAGRGMTPSPGIRPPMRRRVTGEVSVPPVVPTPPPRSGALSPLNPRARGPGGLTGLMGNTSNVATLASNVNPAAALTYAQKQRRPLELNRK